MLSVHVRGREAIGRAQGTDGDYPLISPSTDIQFLIADLLLVTDPVDEDGVLWSPDFRIKQLLGFGTGVNYAAIIVDSEDRVVYDTRDPDTEYRNADYEDRLRIHEWRHTDQGYLRIIEHTARKSTDPDITYSDDIQPTSAIINIEAVEFASRAVQSFPGIAAELNPRGQKVMLQGGYNFGLNTTLPTPGVAGSPSIIQLDARRGAGLGDIRCTQPSTNAPHLYELNGARPDDTGAVFLANGEDDCFSIYVPGAVDPNDAGRWIFQGGTELLALRNDCRPCPPCSDFVNVKTAIDKVYCEVQEQAAAISYSQSQYVEAAGYWGGLKEYLEDHQFFAIKATSMADGATCVQFRLKVPSDKVEGTGPITVTVDAKFGSVLPSSTSSLEEFEPSDWGDHPASGNWVVTYGTFYRTYSSWYPNNIALNQDQHISIPGTITWGNVLPDRDAEFQFCMFPLDPVPGSGEDVEVLTRVTVSMPGKTTRSRFCTTYTFASS